MTHTIDPGIRTAPSPPTVPAETAGFTKVLASNITIAAGGQQRLWPGLDISKWDRLHFTIGADAVAVPSLNVMILQSVTIPGMHCGGLLTSSDIWFEERVKEVEFVHQTPATYGRTGFTMSVPVVAPTLYDVIVRNTGLRDLKTIYVALFAQEI